MEEWRTRRAAEVLRRFAFSTSIRRPVVLRSAAMRLAFQWVLGESASSQKHTLPRALAHFPPYHIVLYTITHCPFTP
jgi:hypothetical protein